MRNTVITSFLATLLVAACTGAGDDSEITLAENSSTASEGAADTTVVMAYYSGTAATPEAGITQVTASVDSSVETPACVTVATDGRTYVDLAFDRCVGTRGATLDGTLHATVTASSSGLVYLVETTDFAINATTVSGAWRLAVPFAPDAPRTWSGMTDIHGPRRSVRLSSMASFTWDGECLALDLDGQVDGGSSLTVSNLSRCIDQCPASGEVTVDYALGSSLAWRYDGTGSVTVTGPRGRTFALTLPCSY